MLLQFELDGQSCEAGAYTFRLDHAINFKQLKLRAVSIQCGNDKLAQTWSYTTTNVAYDGSEANRQLRARRACGCEARVCTPSAPATVASV